MCEEWATEEAGYIPRDVSGVSMRSRLGAPGAICGEAGRGDFQRLANSNDTLPYYFIPIGDIHIITMRGEFPPMRFHLVNRLSFYLTRA